MVTTPQMLREQLLALFPDHEISALAPMGPDAASDAAADAAAGANAGAEIFADSTAKGIGYGVPWRIVLRRADGVERELVWHTAVADEFGHDRRSDRAQEMLLGFDTFAAVPAHVRAVDVGAIAADGTLHSLRDSGEFYLLTEYAPGQIYAADLRRIARDSALLDGDRARCERLAHHLAVLHKRRPPSAAAADERAARKAYGRAIRDLVGHGEGIFGIVDSYPRDISDDIHARLRAIEARCVDWRWRLRDRHHRLRVTHGDFHPFNIVFSESNELALLDASRGCQGDPADDVTCLAINYIFFALGHPGAWAGAFAALWHCFWDSYLRESADRELLEVAAPFLAWRALVLANPIWYPALAPECRDVLLGLAEDAVDRCVFEPESAERLFS